MEASPPAPNTVYPWIKSEKVNGYLFLDGGRIWGSSVFGDRSLMGAGVGIKADLTEKISLNVALGLRCSGPSTEKNRAGDGSISPSTDNFKGGQP